MNLIRKSDRYKKLYKLSNRCAYFQTRNTDKANGMFSDIDNEINSLIKEGVDFSFDCAGKIYQCPVNKFEGYFRPLFKMATHKKIAFVQADDTHAVDFDVPLGTAIYSVSEGVITALRTDNDHGGNDPEFAGLDNYVYIYNKLENRMFCYRHLEKFGELLYCNKTIKEGEMLGKVGMTGYVVTPHLHFVIYEFKKNEKIILKSLPIRFV